MARKITEISPLRTFFGDFLISVHSIYANSPATIIAENQRRNSVKQVPSITFCCASSSLPCRSARRKPCRQPPSSVIYSPAWHRSAYRGMASSARHPPTFFRRLFLRRTDGLPHFVQRHRVKIRSLRYHLTAGQSKIL